MGRPLLLALMLSTAPTLAAQSPSDTAKRQDSSSAQVWGSVGVGLGTSNGGPIAGRAAASLAVNPILMVTVSATSVGGIERAANSTNILVGLKTPDSRRFFFLSAGWAGATCGNSCEGRSGIAVDGGIHAGGKYVGAGLVGFVIQAPGRNSATGFLLSLDFGLFNP